MEKIKNKGKNLLEKGKELTGKRPYSHVEDNPYDDIGSRIGSALVDDEAEGI